MKVIWKQDISEDSTQEFSWPAGSRIIHSDHPARRSIKHGSS